MDGWTPMLYTHTCTNNHHHRMYVRIVQCLFLLFMCQKESKFGRSTALLEVWSGLLGNFLVDWAGSCLARLVVICPGCDIQGGNNVPMGSHQGLWKVVTTSASGRYVGSEGILLVQLRSFGMALSSSVTGPPHPPWSLPRQRGEVTTAHSLGVGGGGCKRVGLIRKTCPGIPGRVRPDPGLPMPKRWKSLLLPESSGGRGGRPTFFLALGLVEHAT